jgi:hypothetical protein
MSAGNGAKFSYDTQVPKERHNPMDETPISRGFRSRRQAQTPKNRLPPGRYVTTDFPALSVGPTLQISLKTGISAFSSAGRCLENGTGKRRSLKRRSKRTFTASRNGQTSIPHGKA